jgi:hypothetical protein
LDVVIAVSTEGSDEEGGMVVEGVVAGDGEEEVTLDIFVLGTPDLLTAFVDNGILVRVVSNGGGTGRGDEEVREELGFRCDGERKIGEDRSGRGRGGDDSDGGFNDGRREVLEGDVGEGNSFNNFFKLEVDVGVLVFGGRGVLKLRAYYVSLLGGDVGKDVEKIGQGGDDGGWGAGAISVTARGEVVATWAGVVPGVVGTVQVLLDDLVGGGDVNLVGVVDLRPVGNGEGGGDNKGW